MTTRSRPLRPTQLAALGAQLLLAGCQPGLGPVELAGSSEVVHSVALVRLKEPWAERGIAVRREVVQNRLIERLVLDNDTALPFENRIEAKTVWRGSDSSPFLRELPAGPFELGTIEAFVANQFPGAAETTKPRDGSNHNGAFAYISATYPSGASCVYAWQVVDEVAWFDRRRHDTAVDMRYCASRGTTDQALALFDAVDIKPIY